jgi:hypothetical protein
MRHTAPSVITNRTNRIRNGLADRPWCVSRGSVVTSARRAAPPAKGCGFHLVPRPHAATVLRETSRPRTIRQTPKGDALARSPKTRDSRSPQSAGTIAEKGAGFTAAGLRTIRAQTLLLVPELDLYNPIEDAVEAATLIPIPSATLMRLVGNAGHAVAADTSPQLPDINRAIGEFLGGSEPVPRKLQPVPRVSSFLTASSSRDHL